MRADCNQLNHPPSTLRRRCAAAEQKGAGVRGPVGEAEHQTGKADESSPQHRAASVKTDCSETTRDCRKAANPNWNELKRMTLLSSHCMVNLFTSTFASFSLSFSLQFFCSHFLLPHFTFSPDRTFFDVLNFKLIDFDSFFVARSFNFSPQGLSSFISEFKFIPFTLCVRTQLWRSSLTTNWSQHNCAFSSFPIPLLYSGSNSLS